MKNLLYDDFSLFVEALSENSPVSLRTNDKLPFEPSNSKVAWCESGFYLKERPLFTADPLFHAGAYYVQEASSMFLEQALAQHVPKHSVTLDLCAAPGGKSTLISQFLGNDGFLVSNEMVRNRAYVLAENLIKWGNDNVLVCNNSPKDFQRLPSFFDVVVVDAPCSGEGMFRKDPASIDEWSEQNVTMCAARQKDILADAWDALKTDGILIYSTCTYNSAENEDNIKWVVTELGAETLRLNTARFPEITVTEHGYRFYPHKTRGEGFFISVLRKNSECPSPKSGRQKQGKQKQKIENSVLTLKNRLSDSESWELIVENNLISAVRREHFQTIEILKSELKTLHFGITLAEQKGKDLIPHTCLALSKSLDAEKISRVEVNEEIAIQYLKKENIFLSEAEKGFVLLTFKSAPIGWVKNLGNRCNNLYPNEWRIRMKNIAPVSLPTSGRSGDF